ncbi:MAG: DotU family type IV/VI secretion system protein [Planctomycetota bacterium]|nr:DotU family type IV/VI secretion system protein [Planctomycetota bacterium]
MDSKFTREFFAVVDPIFDHVLGLCERLEDPDASLSADFESTDSESTSDDSVDSGSITGDSVTRDAVSSEGTSPVNSPADEPGTGERVSISPEQVERERLEALIQQGDLRLEDREEWKLAKYALVVWCDDLFQRLDWRGRVGWVGESLEVHLYGECRGRESFFYAARDAESLVQTEALEVFCICFWLGYRGAYDGDFESLRSRGHPPTPREWIQHATARLGHCKRVPPVWGLHERGHPAPLYGREMFIRSLLVFFLMGVAAAFVCVSTRLLGRDLSN